MRSTGKIIQALNIVIGHHPKAASQIASIGANKHFGAATTSASEKLNLGAGLQAIRGFFVSARAATAQILVNVQVKHEAFYQEGPLERVMVAYLAENGQNKMKLQNFLRRLTVSPTHIVKTNRAGRRIPRMKTISDLATRNDGAGQEYPPMVPEFGAGAHDVQFFLQDTQEGSGRSTGGPNTKEGKRRGKLSILVLRRLHRGALDLRKVLQPSVALHI